jgi:hypothetical protein
MNFVTNLCLIFLISIRKFDVTRSLVTSIKTWADTLSIYDTEVASPSLFGPGTRELIQSICQLDAAHENAPGPDGIFFLLLLHNYIVPILLIMETIYFVPYALQM